MSRLCVLTREGPRLSEERHDDERVDAPEHAPETRRVDVDERQLCLGGDDAGQEGLTGAGLSREEHAFRHFTTRQLEPLDPSEDPHQCLGVLDKVGLAAIVVEGQSDLRVIGGHGVRPRARHEPHHPDETTDVDDHQEDELDEQGRAVRQERAEGPEHIPDAVEDEDDREDPKEDQQPLLVVLEDVRGRRQESSDGQFTPTT